MLRRASIEKKAERLELIASADCDKVSDKESAITVIGTYYLASRLYKQARKREDAKRCERQLRNLFNSYKIPSFSLNNFSSVLLFLIGDNISLIISIHVSFSLVIITKWYGY